MISSRPSSVSLNEDSRPRQPTRYRARTVRGFRRRRGPVGSSRTCGRRRARPRSSPGSAARKCSAATGRAAAAATPGSGNTGNSAGRSSSGSEPGHSAEQDRGQPAAGGAGGGIVEPPGLEEFQQLQAGGVLVPLAVAAHDFQQRLRRLLAFAHRVQRGGEVVAGLMVLRIGRQPGLVACQLGPSPRGLPSASARALRAPEISACSASFSGTWASASRGFSSWPMASSARIRPPQASPFSGSCCSSALNSSPASCGVALLRSRPSPRPEDRRWAWSRRRLSAAPRRSA